MSNIDKHTFGCLLTLRNILSVVEFDNSEGNDLERKKLLFIMFVPSEVLGIVIFTFFYILKFRRAFSYALFLMTLPVWFTQ